MSNPTSDRLTKNASKIMKLWEERANNEILAAFKQESLALRNSLPELLSQIATALSTRIARTQARIRWERKESLRIGKEHGRERAESLDYTMDQMIFEYHILREVICDVLEEEKPLTSIENEVIVCAIEQSVNDAATEFSKTLRGIQEKFALTLAHDLRGQITIAKLNAEFLIMKSEDVTSYVTTAAKEIHQSMNRLDSMIRELLDVSKLKAGEQLMLDIEEFDLTALITESIKEFTHVHSNRIIAISNSPQIVFWSKCGIRRVLENLITNAVKYGTPNSIVTITVKPNDQNVILSVHNIGKPIPAEEQATLFQPFQRTESSKNKSGWGLGLTAVKTITEAHGGTVHLECSNDNGTTFIVSLPRDARMALPKSTK